jgi:hypothetical protein
MTIPINGLIIGLDFWHIHCSPSSGIRAPSIHPDERKNKRNNTNYTGATPMNALSKLATFLSLLVLSAQVQAIEFSFLSNPPTLGAFGNSYSSTAGGLTLTATAWSATGPRGELQTAELKTYPGFGMGACNRNEGANCSTQNHQYGLDNRGAANLILFTFSSSVQLGALNHQQLTRDSDLSLWAGTGNVSLNGIEVHTLGSAMLINNSDRADTLREIGLDAALSGNYEWLIVAARIGEENDSAMLRSLVVNPVGQLINPAVQAIPEAETWAMMLAGLGLVGFAVRRKA